MSQSIAVKLALAYNIEYCFNKKNIARLKKAALSTSYPLTRCQFVQPTDFLSEIDFF